MAVRITEGIILAHVVAALVCAPAAAVGPRSSHLEVATEASRFLGRTAVPVQVGQSSSLLELGVEEGMHEKLDSWVDSDEALEKNLYSTMINDTRLIETLPISNCSAKPPTPGGVKGFQFTHFGHFTGQIKHGVIPNMTRCASICWESNGCNAFSYESTGPVHRCFTYNGLLPFYSRAARSYFKCAKFEKGDACPDSHGFQNYKFSHEGWWPNGIEMKPEKPVKSPGFCSEICTHFPACTGFTWRKPRKDNGMKPECFMYTGRAPIKAPAVAYQRCFVHPH